ncbi:MAG: hypothetical protein UMV23_03355 [Halanaerobium sp.]|nr:hypothetical protein [Halanaerobium sp.]
MHPSSSENGHSARKRKYRLVSLRVNFGVEDNLDKFKSAVPPEVCRLYYCLDDLWGDDRGDF